MYQLIEQVTYVEKIKASKFITILFPVTDREMVKNYLRLVKQQYPKATHYCYAFRLENDQGMSDDKEPSKTAGAPMLQVLIKQNVVNVLAIVVRYYGGIKLGTAGLVKAYQGGVLQALKQAFVSEIEKGIEVTLTFPYDKEKQLLHCLKNAVIIRKEFTDVCCYTLQLPQREIAIIPSFVTIIKRKDCFLPKMQQSSKNKKTNI